MDVKRYENPLDELAECDNGKYCLYTDYLAKGEWISVALPKITPEIANALDGSSLIEQKGRWFDWTQDAVDFVAILNSEPPNGGD
ncbi:MAG: hypothetical protein IME93_03235 [Proteobacteria bacterium]|nr:hypothetical protein [Pseudomonadota bacterium]